MSKYKLTFKGLDTTPEQRMIEWMKDSGYVPVDKSTYPIVEYRLKLRPYQAPVENLSYIVDFKNRTVKWKKESLIGDMKVRIEEPGYGAAEEFRKMGFLGVSERGEDMYSAWTALTDDLYKLGYDHIEMGEYYKCPEESEYCEVILIQPHLKLVEKYHSDGLRNNSGKLYRIGYAPFTKEELKFFDNLDYDLTIEYTKVYDIDITDWWGNRYDL